MDARSNCSRINDETTHEQKVDLDRGGAQMAKVYQNRVQGLLTVTRDLQEGEHLILNQGTVQGPTPEVKVQGLGQVRPIIVGKDMKIALKEKETVIKMQP